MVVVVMPCGESRSGAKHQDGENHELFHDLILARVIDLLHEIRTCVYLQGYLPSLLRPVPIVTRGTCLL